MTSIVKIISRRVEDSEVPARMIAYRRNGSKIEAGDRFGRLALIQLFFLITGEQLLPRDIKYIIKSKGIKVDKHVWAML